MASALRQRRQRKRQRQEYLQAGEEVEEGDVLADLAQPSQPKPPEKKKRAVAASAPAAAAPKRSSKAAAPSTTSPAHLRDRFNYAVSASDRCDAKTCALVDDDFVSMGSQITCCSCLKSFHKGCVFAPSTAKALFTCNSHKRY